MEKERRCFKIKNLKVEVRNNTFETAKRITGYAAVFNRLSENLGGFVEKIAPGAFKKAIKKSDARALFNHDSNIVLGRQSAGTLILKEDDVGLHMTIDPPDTQFARDLVVSIERGDIQEQSFGFTVKADSWEDMDKDIAVRTLEEIDQLYDVSPVTYPAYPDTTVAVRSLEDSKNAENREKHNRENPETKEHSTDDINKIDAFWRDAHG